MNRKAERIESESKFEIFKIEFIQCFEYRIQRSVGNSKHFEFSIQLFLWKNAAIIEI